MRILGIGVDVIENKRIKPLIKKKKFLSRIFTKKEIWFSKNLRNKTNYFAKRFAAKESFSKAIGSGFRNNINFNDIEILNDKMGKPYFKLSNKIDSILKKNFKLKRYDLFLSISDEKDYSVAFTILQNT